MSHNLPAFRLTSLFAVVVSALYCEMTLAEDKPSADATPDAVEIAEAWVVALMSGKVDEVMSLSTVPFSWDRKMLVTTEGQLKDLYGRVVADKGARDLRPSKVEIADDALTAKLHESATFEKKPDFVAVIAYFGDEGIGILVAKGPTLKVCGFSD